MHRDIFKMYTVIKEKFERIVAENELPDKTVVIGAKPSTPEEPIGNPESRGLLSTTTVSSG